jgi:ubiquinone/menaquinone biosynthesis C-methylase UbiE
VQNTVRRLLFEYLYFRQPPWDTGISPPELLEFIKEHEPGRAIDIGCGTGTNVITLAQAGWKVTGIDFASRAIKIARRKLEQSGVQAELRVRDATQLYDISGPYDFALDLGCFHGVLQERRANYLEELYRILAPGGFWLLYGFLKSEAGQSEPGLMEADIGLISSQLTLLSRRDGVDSGRGRPSVWFLFQKQ